jgi:UDP-3-O-[3-hydroxymyristoyl] glucosamine N-acyltransferase
VLFLPQIRGLKSLKVKEIAEFLDGNVIGNENETFIGVSKIDQSLAGSLSFVANPKYEGFISETSAKVILVAKDKGFSLPDSKIFIEVTDPYLAFCEVLNKYFNPALERVGISPRASVHEDANIGENVYLGENVVIESGAVIGQNSKIFPNSYIGSNVQIGSNCLVYAGVFIYHDCSIGNEVIIHSGTVVGSDGFGHAPKADGTYVKIPQIGNVVIEDRVEIGSNCSIDRATLGSTIIRSGVKLDNLIQVAHNVEIGANTVIASQSGISGSTILGSNCVIGGQVGFAGHLKIANGTQVGAQSGLGKNVDEENQRLFGTPVMPLKDALRTHVIIRKLPELKEKIENLEKQINSEHESQ